MCHTTYNCLKKEKIATISKYIIKDSNSKEKKLGFYKIRKNCFFVSFSFMLKDLFCKTFLTIKCILGSKIYVITLVDTFATRFDFNYEKFGETIYEKLEIQIK